MTDEIQYPDTPFLLAPALAFFARRGSESHGTFIPSTDPDSIDDRDLLGVCIPPPKYYIGLSHWEAFVSLQRARDASPLPTELNEWRSRGSS